ncbi:MAG: hypothetical protein QXL96_02820 [Ignisphaera sp.]
MLFILPGIPKDILNILYQITVPIIITIVIVMIIYVAIKKILAKIRTKGLISRGAEEAIRFALFAVLTVIVVAIALSSWFQIHIVSITFIALLLIISGFILYSMRVYIENTISYILFVSSNVVRDGDTVRVDLANKVYEGRISIAEGGYAIIDTGDNKVYIPYSTLLRSVIVKPLHNVAKFKLMIKGQSLELNKVVGEVRDIILKDLKMINKENIDIKPVKVKDDEVVLGISIEVPNPRNISECYETLARLLTWRLSYKFSLEFD